ncbi:MAG: helix-turn-helix transcriptional regulator [Vallitaleaceae bacterium]|jgi:transcriptional regulator with XRE-family HTH domain|nr:helix-turn-helix transcriptional regulator [Vallitaleaceae bacterium]
MYPEMTLGQKVKEARIHRQLTQKELAGDFITRNMLSQIENDIATPSIKTIEHIASILEKPVSYFIDHNIQRVPESELIEKIMALYEDEAFDDSIIQLEQYFEEHPKATSKRFLRNIYMNCCLQAAKVAKTNQDFDNSKRYYEKILAYETDLMFYDDAILYNIYSELAEVNARIDTVDESKSYDVKATYLVNKMVANQIIQGMYIAFVEGKYDKVITKIRSLDTKDLDNHNKGRYFMMIGSAYYYKESFEMAIKYLEKAIPYYRSGTYNSIITMIYEDLSKCYSNLEDYKKAYEYLQKSKRTEVVK